MADKSLALWLHGVHVADIDEPSPFRYRLRFTAEALDRYGAGATVLSLGLPVTPRPVRDGAPPVQPVAAYLRGLLPEGDMLIEVARALRVSQVDTLGLLAGVGMECAGAVQVLPPGVPPTAGSVLPLSGAQVAAMVAALPRYAAPDGPIPHASLGGLQDKLLLTRLPDGSWGWPQAGAASTHIIKPAPLAGPFPYLLEAEAWTLELARRAGLAAADAQLEEFDSRRVLVIQRYDRTPAGSRIHQEDGCQVLGLPPEAKYETPPEHPSRLSRLASKLSASATDPAAIRQDLLRQVSFNVAIGNSDAHTKNYSVLLSPGGEPGLAPLYDCAPLWYMNPRFREAGQTVNGRVHLDEITAADLVQEGCAWGMTADEARCTVADTRARLDDHLRDVPDPSWQPGLPDAIRRGIERLG